MFLNSLLSQEDSNSITSYVSTMLILTTTLTDNLQMSKLRPGWNGALGSFTSSPVVLLHVVPWLDRN